MKIADVAADGLGLVGAGLLSYGGWLVYQPAGFIVAGLLLLFAAWVLSAGPVRDATRADGEGG